MIGQTISHYKILEKLGEGGMGVVYKAEDTKLKRTVALKFLTWQAVGSDEEKSRFLREAQAAAALSHPHIATVYEIDEVEGETFIAMEYIEGESLKEKIESGPLKLDDAIDMAIQIAEGLQEAHEKGIVHRDIKSSNIILNENGQVKIMDFGLAKVRGSAQLTKVGTILGTAAYMSPEQARGEGADHRTDIWSLGIVLYEIITGQLPFRGDYEQAVIYSILNEEPEPVTELRTGLPEELGQVVNKALTKDRDKRFQSASELLQHLKNLRSQKLVPQETEFDVYSLLGFLKRPRIAIPALALFIVLIISVIVWVKLYQESSAREFARREQIPKLYRLSEEGEYENAFILAKEVEEIVPGDSMLMKIWDTFSREVDIDTEPHGVKVYRKAYGEENTDWQFLGITPLENIRFPYVYSMMKFEKPGYEVIELATHPYYLRTGENKFNLPLKGDIPESMLLVPGGRIPLNMPGLDHLGKVDLNAYLIDKFEVTNSQFQGFVDAGGYENKEFWNHEFVKEGQFLSWEEGISLFKDRTGQTGPATWEAGRFPDGKDNYPVSGISWPEAAAYAEYVGKALPTIYHWNRAADTRLSSKIVPQSNFDNEGPALVGQYKGVSSFGAFDMAGNVREWCVNATENGQRVILGGGWNDLTYMFNDYYAQDPFDRSVTNGFRCMKFLTPKVEQHEAANPIELLKRDFLNETLVSDEVFKIYLSMFSYDKGELNPVVDEIDTTGKLVITEKIYFNAAYGNERMFAYLFIPKNAKSPSKTIVYFPGSNAIHDESSDAINLRQFDFLLKNGYAVIHPIYKGTYERGDFLDSDYPDTTTFYRDHVIMWAKDMSRSIDYLETRKDIDSENLAYFGVSWGGEMGGIMLAVEDRFKTGILYVAGLSLQRALPEADAINYVSRIKLPVLMLNGKYDHFFPVETSQVPMFKLLATPEEHKRHYIYETGHSVPRDELIKEVLNWLSTYLS